MRTRTAAGQDDDRGASLIDALVAVAVVITVTTGVAQLVLWSRRAIWAARTHTIAVTLAEQKLEQLRSLDWTIDATGASISDESTDVSVDPPGPGGTGLQPTPAGTLAVNTPGYVDYVDAAGGWRGNSPDPPRGAAFVRRWSIEPLPFDAVDTLVITVLVTSVADAAVAREAPARGVRLRTIRTRVGR